MKKQPMARLIWVFGAALACATPAGAIDLTFLGWADQHIGNAGESSHLTDFVTALNTIEGTPLPASIGGVVQTPAFIVSAGDQTDWPTWAAKEEYNRIITQDLNYPTYDVLGNHDQGGFARVPTMINWFVDRYNPPGAVTLPASDSYNTLDHGELSYSFQYDGVHFSMLNSHFDDNWPPVGVPDADGEAHSQPITQQAIDWLTNDLASVDPFMPVVVVTHMNHDSITNKDEFVTALEGKNVVLIIGGHYEEPRLQHYGGYNWVQLGSPRNEDLRTINAFRITDDMVTSVVWDIPNEQWLEQFNVHESIVTPEPGALGMLAAGTLALLRRRTRR